MLFNVRGGDRYDGLVSVTFKDGKLADVLPNASTDDPEWIPFIRELSEGLVGLYPDGGTDGLSGLAERFFLPSARGYFWKALSTAGIYSDRDAARHGMDRRTTVFLVAMLQSLIYIDGGVKIP